MSDNKKHAPPLRCKLRRAIMGHSRAAITTKCYLGLWRSCEKCKGCEANAHEVWFEKFQKGLDEVLKAPLLGIDLGKGPDLTCRNGRAYLKKEADK